MAAEDSFIRLIIKPFLLGSTIACIAAGMSCNRPQNKIGMEKNTNPLLCDPETGVCEMPAGKTEVKTTEVAKEKPVKIIYYTDPICSSCWGIEPQLKKLKLEYGHDIEIEYRMGGLLPDWSYNSGGISKPSDVAHHWDEVSAIYEMPIDGDVWLEDPLSSSYPPSIAFKAAQMQDKEKAIKFLRLLREELFLEKKNITKWEYVEKAALGAGLDSKQLKIDYEGKAKGLFEEDLKLARQLGVRGFPTMLYYGKDNQQTTVYGSKPYAEFENAAIKMFPEIEKQAYDQSWEYLFFKFGSLTTKEFAVLAGISKQQAETGLDQLYNQKKLEKVVSKNGNLFRKL